MNRGEPQVDDSTTATMTSETERYYARQAEIRADRNLSDEGKRNALTELFEKTTAKLDAVEGKAQKADASRRQTLETSLFGMGYASGADVIAYRDAVDRVSRVKRPEELGELMQNASISGDRTLLRAAFHHAYKKSTDITASADWDALVAAYLEENPGERDRLDEYRELTSSASRSHALTHRLATRPMKPSELR